MRMSLLRCPKFLRCLTADAGNFDRSHSLTSLPLPPAALSSLPTSARPDLHRTPCKNPVIARPVRTLAVAIRVPCLKPPLRKGRWREAPEGPPPPHPLFRTKRRGVEDAAPYEQTPFRQERHSLRLTLIFPFSTFSFLPFFSPISVVILRRICYTILSKNNILPESRDAL